MSKKQKTVVSTLPDIDQAYESRHTYLDAMPADPGAAMSSGTAIEPVRQQPPRSWVPGQAAPVRARRMTGAEVAQVANGLTANATNGQIDGSALAALETVSEKSTPIDRTLAWGIVGLVCIAVCAIVSFAMNQAGLNSTGAWIVFGVSTLISIAVTYQLSNVYSPTGVERFKSGKYTEIRHHEIDSNERISMKKLEIFERVLGVAYATDEDD